LEFLNTFTSKFGLNIAALSLALGAVLMQNVTAEKVRNGKQTWNSGN
jgi:hypothetical protein